MKYLFRRIQYSAFLVFRKIFSKTNVVSIFEAKFKYFTHNALYLLLHKKSRIFKHNLQLWNNWHNKLKLLNSKRKNKIYAFFASIIIPRSLVDKIEVERFIYFQFRLEYFEKVKKTHRYFLAEIKWQWKLKSYKNISQFIRLV